MFKPTPQALEAARAKYAAAEAAVRVALTGGELSEDLAVERAFLSSVETLHEALAVYAAVVLLEAPKKVLAAARNTQAARIRAQVRFVEAWRDAPLISNGLALIEKTLPRAL